VVPLPHPFDDPDGWYQALDVGGLDRLPRDRVLEALTAVLSVKGTALRAAIWKKGKLRGKLTLADCKELLGDLKRDLPKISRKASTHPDIEQARIEDWFAYWDIGGAGVLTREEARRAILKSFPNHDLPLLRAAIDVAWQQNAQLHPECADMVSSDAFRDGDSGLVCLALQKYKAAKYWKLWGADDCNVGHLPRCLSCLSDDAL
jgi:hypothetical protein